MFSLAAERNCAGKTCLREMIFVYRSLFYLQPWMDASVAYRVDLYCLSELVRLVCPLLNQTTYSFLKAPQILSLCHPSQTWLFECLDFRSHCPDHPFEIILVIYSAAQRVDWICLVTVYLPWKMISVFLFQISSSWQVGLMVFALKKESFTSFIAILGKL